MKRAFTATTLSILLFMVIVFGCRSGVDTSKPETQKKFGVRMAKMNLWREAMFRFERAIEINPADAQAHNNLAVAYEANGDFEKARKEYLEALKLDRTNPYIQKNYSRFVEFLSRNRKRQAATPKVTAAPLNGVPTGASTTSVVNAGQPDRPTAGSVPPPATNPPSQPPSDRPQPAPPTPPPTPNPPGGLL